jgi:outer membrane protein OmpA-like peptidoglycan-associated protein
VKIKAMLVIGTAMGLSVFAQASPQTTLVDSSGPAPTFRVVVVSRTVQAVNYGHRSEATDVDFAGTALLPSADGKAKVRSKRGTIEVEADFGNLQAPTTFGGEYLTYVMWAISPEGRAVNLGEVIVGGNDRSKLTATTDLQAFALIVTAEPYYAVRQPSNVVVLENVVRSDTRGTSEAVNAKYELMERGGYLPTGYKFDPVVLKANLPREFYEARNALRIAESEGAEIYAAESYQHASSLMKNADDYAVEKHHDRQAMIAVSRQAVQTAEDAREIAVKKIDEVRLAGERQASSDKQGRLQVQADDAARMTTQAQIDAANARAAADRARADMAANQSAATAAVSAAQADSANAQANLAATQATSAAAVNAAQTDAANANANMVAHQAASAAAVTAAQTDAANANANMVANQAASAAAVTAAQADAANANANMAANRAASAAALAAAQTDADQSRLAAQRAQEGEHQANSDKAAMRAQLSEQLNKILETRDSARGLIVSMSDVLFDSGQYSLKPGAREKLAKVAGILIAYPGLNIAVGGYTDNVGGDEMNQKLSENRAGAVRGYLVQEGVSTNSVTAQGFGNTAPVASNDNSSGRQENRRVELVVSGDAIGSPVNATTGSLR